MCVRLCVCLCFGGVCSFHSLSPPHCGCCVVVDVASVTEHRRAPAARRPSNSTIPAEVFPDSLLRYPAPWSSGAPAGHLVLLNNTEQAQPSCPPPIAPVFLVHGVCFRPVVSRRLYEPTGTAHTRASYRPHRALELFSFVRSGPLVVHCQPYIILLSRCTLLLFCKGTWGWEPALFTN